MNTMSPFFPSVDAEAIEPTHERIAARAWEIWRERDCSHDQDVEILLEAEAELHAIFCHEYRYPRRLDIK